MESSPSLTVDRPSLCETPVMVVLQAREYWHIPTVVEVLVEAGLPCVEITASTPGALATIGAIHKYCCDDIDIGMGAVLRTEQVRAAAEAGAGFVVCPNTDPAVAACAHELALGYFPGAFTATEIVTADSLGAAAVALFPAMLGGPAYLAQLRAHMPDIPPMATGDIPIADAVTFIRMGAAAVGMGRPLVGDALTGGDLTQLRHRISALREALNQIRPTSQHW